METTAISNVQDLHAEIGRLRALSAEQTTALAERFSKPSALFTWAGTSLFRHSGAAKLWVEAQALLHKLKGNLNL